MKKLVTALIFVAIISCIIVAITINRPKIHRLLSNEIGHGTPVEFFLGTGRPQAIYIRLENSRIYLTFFFANAFTYNVEAERQERLLELFDKFLFDIEFSEQYSAAGHVDVNEDVYYIYRLKSSKNLKSFCEQVIGDPSSTIDGRTITNQELDLIQKSFIEWWE